MIAGRITDDIKLMIMMTSDEADQSFVADYSDVIFFVENENPKCTKPHCKPLVDSYDIFWCENPKWWKLVRNEKSIIHIEWPDDNDMTRIQTHLKDYYVRPD